MKYSKFLLLFILLLCSVTRAQSALNAPAAPLAEQQKIKKEREKKALAMLNEVIESIPSFKLPENRLRLMARSANLLWPYDEKRARQLFTDLTTQCARLNNLPEDAPESLPEQAQMQFQQFRHEIAQLIVARSTQLALEFVRATRPPPETAPAGYNQETETNLEMSLAYQIAQKDPKRALQLAEEKLAAGLNPAQLSGVLSTLHQQDAEAAQKLLGSLMNRLRKNNWTMEDGTAYFALELLSFAPSPDPEASGETPTDAPRPLVTAAIARELIEKTLATAQSELAVAEREKNFDKRNTAIAMLSQLNSMMPYVEKYAGSSAANLKRLLTDNPPVNDPGQAMWEQLQKLSQQGNPQTIVQAARNATPEQQHYFHEAAAQVAQEKGDIQQARRILTENLTDVALRRQALAEVDRREIYRLISEKKFEQARPMMPRIRNLSERAAVLLQMSAAALAENAGQKENQQQATRFLDEAWALVGGPLESNQQLMMQIQICQAFLPFNPARSFDILEATIDRFNEFAAATVQVESFEQSGAVREGEMVLNMGRSYHLLLQYAQPLESLAHADFERVRAFVSRFARPEIRTNLSLEIVEKTLNQAQ